MINNRPFLDDDSPDSIKRWEKLINDSPESKKDRLFMDTIKNIPTKDDRPEFWRSLYSELNLNVKSAIYTPSCTRKERFLEWLRPLAIGCATAAAMFVIFVAGYNAKNSPHEYLSNEDLKEMQFYLKEHYLAEDADLFAEEPITTVLISTSKKHKRK